MNSKVIIFDCNGEQRPTICFSLEVARFAPRIVADEKEALNLLKISLQTKEPFDCLLVNNPYLNVDITWLVEQWQKLATDVPIVFVKQSEPLKRIILKMNQDFPDVNLYFSEPEHVTELLLSLSSKRALRNENLINIETPKKNGWRWQWKKQS